MTPFPSETRGGARRPWRRRTFAVMKPHPENQPWHRDLRAESRGTLHISEAIAELAARSEGLQFLGRRCATRRSRTMKLNQLLAGRDRVSK